MSLQVKTTIATTTAPAFSGRTKCSDNPYHDDTIAASCSSCQQLRQKASPRSQRRSEEKCVGDPCTNLAHFLGKDKVHCPSDADKEVRARVLYGRSEGKGRGRMYMVA